MLLSITDLFAAGIGCDAAGAMLLARGLLLSPDQHWRRQTYAGQETRQADEAIDRVMSTVGVSALVLGFTVQAVGYVLSLGIDEASEPSAGRALVAGVCALFAAGAVLSIERITRRHRARAFVLRAACARSLELGLKPAGALALMVLAPYARRELGLRAREGDARDVVSRVFKLDVVAVEGEEESDSDTPSSPSFS